MESPQADNFRYHFELAQQDVNKGVVSARATAANNHWNVWLNFCSELGLDPTLQDIQDPIPFLQVFIYRYRNGDINPSKRKVRSRTVEDAVRSVGQTLKAMGAEDPRLTTQGNTDFRLQRMFAAYKKQDPPPNRVKPIPIQLIQHIMGVATKSTNDHAQATADMIALAFFFLLRPGEYTGNKSDTTPFRLCDVGLFIGNQRINPLHAPIESLWNATFVTLEFTTQKNGVRGEVIGLGRSGNTDLCPVFATIRRIIHLRTHGAHAQTPLASVWACTKQKFNPILPSDITNVLRLATTILGPQLGFLPKHISARSLRAAGAMTLLCGEVDPNIIQILGRWRSDQMLRYLHTQAAPVMKNFASIMLNGGHFTIHPNHEVPML